MKEWITGRNPVYEVLRARRRHLFRLQVARGVEEKGRLAEILKQAQTRKVPLEWVPRQQLDALGENHQGVAVQCSAYPYSTVADILALAGSRQEAPFLLVLDVIQNPQNLGALLRSAEAVGVHGVLIPLARAAGITPAVVHASAGASEHQLVAAVNLAQALEGLKKEGLWILGLEGSSAAADVQQARLDGPLALVVGSEGEGMRNLVRRSCDLLVRLPMLGRVDSLNAAVAGSVVLYQALFARRAKQDKQ
ncbi:MAG: 23S rRNA (guanosine(2251)-2'-O)-methyltransferase RlmB [Anaerolineaceae bacterium]|nr:23S rRNA (guanosine(2251)-2'-O)-methyltransferase RlmB [Anaerolineaceae bacterium]